MKRGYVCEGCGRTMVEEIPDGAQASAACAAGHKCECGGWLRWESVEHFVSRAFEEIIFEHFDHLSPAERRVAIERALAAYQKDVGE